MRSIAAIERSPAEGLLFERRQQYAEAERELRASLAINENGGVWHSLASVTGARPERGCS